MNAFGTELRALRSHARLSQMALALDAEISQRHLSFLESGKAEPGRAIVERLAAALKLSPPVTNALLEKAGYSPLFVSYDWSDRSIAPLRRAADEVLTRHVPYPAVLVRPNGDVIKTNPSFKRALGLIDAPDALWGRSHDQGQQKNLLRLSLHPSGTAAAMVNFEPVAKATLQRATREAQGADGLDDLLQEISTWPNIDPDWLKQDWGPAPVPIMEERYKTVHGVLSVFAMITTLGTPLDASPVRIESYFPTDEISRDLLQSVA